MRLWVNAGIKCHDLAMFVILGQREIEGFAGIFGNLQAIFSHVVRYTK